MSKFKSPKNLEIDPQDHWIEASVIENPEDADSKPKVQIKVGDEYLDCYLDEKEAKALGTWLLALSKSIKAHG